NTYWTDENFDRVERMRSIAADLGCEVPQLVVAWVLSKPVVTSVIVGSSRPEQVAKNALAVGIKPTDDVLQILDSL
ncbi:MAG: aldo/keto reductase, partial [Chloroflexi bacterium]|nr:aldo/keto reductase [Chloroflexota bacterium]